MKTIAYHLQKGGVGKTSLSVSTAKELSKTGKTIIVDCDPQGNSTSWLLDKEPIYELAMVLYGRIKTSEAIVKIDENFDILPTLKLGELPLFGENQLSEEPYIFCDLTEMLKELNYEYVIFDLSPSFSKLERAVLIACDYVFTPMTAEIFSLDGIEIFRKKLDKLKKSMRIAGAKHTHIIINAYNSSISQHKTILSSVKEIEGYNIFTVPIDPVFRKAQALHETIDSLTGKDRAKKETLETIENIAQSIITL